VANYFYRIVENLYRSVYGQHRFYENVLGIDVQVYRLDRDTYHKYQEAYGRGVVIPTSYSPLKTSRIVASIHTISKLTEETSNLGEITCYTYDKDIDVGDLLKTTLGNKTVALFVSAVQKIGYFVDIVYELTLKPDKVNDIKAKQRTP
jgi:hypothetical protein